MKKSLTLALASFIAVSALSATAQEGEAQRGRATNEAEPKKASPQPRARGVQAVVSSDAPGTAAILFERKYWAVVDADGTLNRGHNVVSATKLGTGIYEVTFNRSVRDGVYQATLGSIDFGAGPNGEIGVASRFGNAAGVWIQTYDSAGAPADRPFHLLVFTD